MSVQEILDKYLQDISPYLPLNQNGCTTSFVKSHSLMLLFSVRMRCRSCFSLFVFPSLPPLWFSLSLSNQEMWPLTLQLNVIKLLSILQLVASQERQCSLTQSLISALDTILYIFSHIVICWFGVWSQNIEALEIHI